MSDNYIIEIRPKSVGITVQAGVVIRDGRGFRFFAATDAFNSLEGQLFKNPKAAERAALCHVADIAAPRATGNRLSQNLKPRAQHVGFIAENQGSMEN
jgi:hypothetical protein